MAAQFTEEENALKCLVQCFYKNSKGDDVKETLTVEEFKAMIKNNFPNLMKDCKDPEQLLKCFDTNSDNQMKYSEYFCLLEKLAHIIKREEKKKH